MRGVFRECFDIPGWGGIAVALLPDDEEFIQAGDWLIVADRRWQVCGVPHVKRVIDDPETRQLVSAVLIGANKLELESLVGQRFETSRVKAEE